MQSSQYVNVICICLECMGKQLKYQLFYWCSGRNLTPEIPKPWATVVTAAWSFINIKYLKIEANHNNVRTWIQHTHPVLPSSPSWAAAVSGSVTCNNEHSRHRHFLRLIWQIIEQLCFQMEQRKLNNVAWLYTHQHYLLVSRINCCHL